MSTSRRSAPQRAGRREHRASRSHTYSRTPANSGDWTSRGGAQLEPVADVPHERWTTELQQAAKTWVLDRAEYNAMVTFTFNKDDGVSYEQAKWTFGLFMRRLRDYLWGRRCNSKRRIAVVPVVENYAEQLQKRGIEVVGREGTHIHCLMALPGDAAGYREVVRDLWVDTHPVCGDPVVYCPDSDDWFVPVSNEQLREVYAGYILKRCQFDVDGLLVQYM